METEAKREEEEEGRTEGTLRAGPLAPFLGNHGKGCLQRGRTEVVTDDSRAGAEHRRGGSGQTVGNQMRRERPCKTAERHREAERCCGGRSRVIQERFSVNASCSYTSASTGVAAAATRAHQADGDAAKLAGLAGLDPGSQDIGRQEGLAARRRVRKARAVKVATSCVSSEHRCV